MNIKRIIGTTLVFGAIGTAAATSAIASPNERLEPGDYAFVDVTVATLWGKPGLDRPIDAPSLTNPVNLDTWNASMRDTETRRWLTGKLETQAVLGSKVQVTEISGTWAHVVVLDQSTPRDERGYPGWVPTRQLVENNRFGKLKTTRNRAVVTENTAALHGGAYGKHREQKISFNTELPILKHNRHGAKVALPNGRSAWLKHHAIDMYAPTQKPAQPTGSDLVTTGKQFLGLRYLWAGVSAYGFDCSGFTYTIYRAHGIDIPRDSGPQATTGTSVSAERLQQGDLLFFAKPGGVGSVHHVGMYIGGGRMIHAPNASESVSIVDWKTWDTNKEFSGARRIL